MTNSAPKQIKKMEGFITSDKMDKTVVVEVEKTKMDSKYLKRFKVSKKYKAHDENNEYKTGDRVIIEETRPLSKDKCWKVVKKVAVK
jgi:small subunit ribosomal protein S17